MKMITMPSNLILWHGAFALLLTGCSMGSGPGGNPGGGYGRPAYPPISQLPRPGSPPWYNVGYPGFPGRPTIPVVLNPTPGVPAPNPGQPTSPSPPTGTPPGNTPTIPIGLPGTETPNERSLEYWSPWPLPPRGKTSSVGTDGFLRGEIRSEKTPESRIASERFSGSNFDLKPVDTDSAELVLTSLQFDEGLREFVFDDEPVAGLMEGGEETADDAKVDSDDLIYHGGRLISDLSYVNLYVGGDTSWSRSDVEQIDSRLAAAMRDEGLNNVLRQYFNNEPIRSTALPSHPLVGYTPKTVTRGDIQLIMEWLHRQGFLKSFELRNTVFNLLLPAGTVLTVNDQPSISLRDDIAQELPGVSVDQIAPPEEGDSRAGLAGYHGSVVTRNDERLYYTVNVYSESRSNGAMNGISIFREPWRNVVATLYHHLAEVRTNPDVEEAMRQTSESVAKGYLGWVSPAGLEVGDYPIRARIPIRSVFKEVPLSSGQGVVPIQLLYSNAARGPEGPISRLHTLPTP